MKIKVRNRHRLAVIRGEAKGRTSMVASAKIYKRRPKHPKKALELL